MCEHYQVKFLTDLICVGGKIIGRIIHITLQLAAQQQMGDNILSGITTDRFICYGYRKVAFQAIWQGDLYFIACPFIQPPMLHLHLWLELIFFIV